MTPAPPPLTFFSSLWLLTSSFLQDKRLLAPHSTVLTATHTHTQHPPSLLTQTGQDSVFVLFSQTAWEEGKRGWGGVVAEKEPAIRGVGRRRISDVLNFKKKSRANHT